MSERITLNLNESNDIRFDVKITSTERLNNQDGIKLRLVCEINDIEYSFRGEAIDDGSVQVIVPPMKNSLAEGIYSSRLEVIVEGRYFVPLEFDTEFKVPLKVVAEGVRVMSEKTMHDYPVNVNVSAKMKSSPAPQKKNIATKQERNVLHEMNELIKELE